MSSRNRPSDEHPSGSCGRLGTLWRLEALQRATGRDPVGPLAGGLGNGIEVLVAVQQREVVDLSEGRDQKIDGGQSMPAGVRRESFARQLQLADGPGFSTSRARQYPRSGPPLRGKPPPGAYELPPIASELNGWLDDVEALIDEVAVRYRASAAR